jgi:beta-ureidopropionase / N-carbamoyl-L-amino-acid hydrolase
MTPWSDGRVSAPSLDRISQDLLTLAAITETGQEGWTRTVLSDASAEGRHWVLRRMREAGLQARVDAIGNVVGLLPGRSCAGGALITGSHTDTVEGGGRSTGVHALTQCLVAADSGAV